MKSCGGNEASAGKKDTKVWVSKASPGARPVGPHCCLSSQASHCCQQLQRASICCGHTYHQTDAHHTCMVYSMTSTVQEQGIKAGECISFTTAPCLVMQQPYPARQAPATHAPASSCRSSKPQQPAPTPHAAHAAGVHSARQVLLPCRWAAAATEQLLSLH